MKAQPEVIASMTFAFGKYNGRLCAGLDVRLPGVEPAKYQWHADEDAVEELAAFYDDVTHALHVEEQLMHLAIDDLCCKQLNLF